MPHLARWFLGVILAGCGAISASAQQSPDSPSPARAATQADAALPPGHERDAGNIQEGGRRDEPWKSFSEVTKNARAQSGLFTLYLKRDNTYLSLVPAQLDRDYLLVTQLSQGIGDLGLDGGTSMRSDLIRFHRAGDRIELWVVNPRFAAAAGTPMARAVEKSFGHSVAQSFPIATIRDNGEILFDLAPFLLSDWADLGAFLQGVAAQRKLSGSIALDRERSSIQGLRLYSGNLEAEVHLTYQSNRNLGLETVADYRWIPVGVHYSLLELPATPMRPRYADERVGYFVSAIKDFSRDTAESFFVRFVNRWRLEKRDPSAALSEPIKPIVYYIDRTVPNEWRPWVRAGILEWNRAFEGAGFRNAIQVFDAPDDTLWSAEDARYSTVRWTATNRSVYAIGPTNVDPRTGEILNADVLVSAAWIQTWRGESGEYVAPLAAVGSVFLEDSAAAAAGSETRLCSLGDGLRRQSTVARAVLGARQGEPEGVALTRRYIGQALKSLIMHEIGHTLGLRHNFRGSAGVTKAQLADKAYTKAHGLGVSVMDYNPPALSRDPRQQGDYFAGTVGSYDRWAIRYGYAALGPHEPVTVAAKGSADDVPAWTPDAEVNALRRVASEAADPSHLYGTDEDAGFGGYGLDPTVSRYDQTDDPLGWARDRVALINSLFDSLDTRMVAPGQGYARLRRAFTDLLTDRWYAMLVTTKYLGGATTARDHRGDPSARPAVTTVPAGRQREALAFLTQAAFGEQAYRFKPELLSKLGPDRWRHWGANPSAHGRIDFPMHSWAATQQSALLAQLLDPVVLSRIRDAELRATAGEQTVTIPELFGTLTRAIWTEAPAAGAGKPTRPPSITSVRRDLQRAYLNGMIQMVVSPLPDTPEDARTLARVTLADLGAELDRSLIRRGELDPYTRAHLVDSRERISQALNAQMIQTAGLAR
ncbi:MAG TPA: zinc-dependent metalloprotease [Gemmatimonadales bacterium]|nr:zinc-dependent metalloprotease [Gemmatimonadales bacterium]